MWHWLREKFAPAPVAKDEPPPPRHFFFHRVPKRVSSWKLSRDDKGMTEVPIREYLVWDKRSR
jgi:hypothetical protein